MLVEGPVTVTGDDGVAVTSDRFVVAVCTCRRSRSYPWCDTSHRRRTTRGPAEAAGDDRCGDGLSDGYSDGLSDEETGGEPR
jgi:CDGSH-type Zn-finger protein